MASLAEAVLTPHRKDPRIRCGVNDWINTLPEAEQNGAQALLADRMRRTTSLFDLFAENGFQLQYDSLVRHRNGRCSCR